MTEAKKASCAVGDEAVILPSRAAVKAGLDPSKGLGLGLAPRK